MRVGEPPAAAVQVRILGPVEIQIGQGTIAPSRRLARTLLGVLALRANAPVGLYWLVDALWEGRPPRSAAANIRSYVADLRRLLGAGEGPSAGPRITNSAGQYVLASPTDAVDLLRFRALLSTGRRALAAGQPHAAAENLRAACELWRGPLFEGTAVPSALAATTAALDDERMTALEAYIDARLRLGEHNEMVSELAGLTAAHGLRETLWRQRMRVLWRCGRSAEALWAYDELADLLDRQLGAAPGPQTQDLRVRILRGNLTAQRPGPWLLPPDPVPFVGRQAELAALGGTGPGVRVVTGPPGVGKTACAVHWARRVADRFPDGCIYVDLDGYGPREPKDPRRAVLELAEALGVPTPPVRDLDQLPALYRSLCHGRRLLVVLDNARSAEQVRPLLPTADGAMAVVTSRNSLLGLVARDGARPIRLGVMTPATAAELFLALVGPRAAPEPEAVEALTRSCSRLPLAVRVAASLALARPTEPLRTLADELADESRLLDLLDDTGDPRTSVRTVLSWSYLALPAPDARAFRLLGLHPAPSFDASTLAAAAATSLAESSRALAALARAHLVTFTDRRRYGMHRLIWLYAREVAERADPLPGWESAAPGSGHEVNLQAGASKKGDTCDSRL